MPPFKILHVLNALRHSGAERAVELLGPLARADGIDAHILAVIEDGEIGPFAPRLAAAGYALHVLRFSRDARFPFRVLEFMRAHRFDAVHIHCEQASFWIAAAAWLGGTRRIVRTVNSLFVFDGALRLRRAVQRAAARVLFGMVSVTSSQGMIDNERIRFGSDVAMLRYWIDTERFGPASETRRRAARAELGIAEGEYAMALVGACRDAKNHAGAIEAAALLEKRGLPVRLLHVGEGALTATETALARRLGIAERVTFLGPRDDVDTILAASDIYLMPSTLEGLGLAGVEAIAAALPCVFVDGPGIGDLAAYDGQVAWVAADSSAIADAIFRQAGLPEAAWRERALAASRKIRSDYAPELAWMRLRALYGLPVNSAIGT